MDLSIQSPESADEQDLLCVARKSGLGQEVTGGEEYRQGSDQRSQVWSTSALRDSRKMKNVPRRLRRSIQQVEGKQEPLGG